MEIFESKAGQVYLPGDTIINITDISLDDNQIKFGPGIRLDGKQVIAYKAGILRTKVKPLCAWIETNQKRYTCMKGDTVIGIITNRGADNYKVDIGASQLATLSTIMFEGATKRHKPNLKILDLVFAKMTVANKDMEPEISCIDENNKGNNLGPLTGGYMFTASLGLCRQLLEMPESKVLALLGRHFPFEVVVGMNGRIWINSKGIIDTIAIVNAIVSSEFMDTDQMNLMVKQLVDSIAGFNDQDE